MPPFCLYISPKKEIRRSKKEIRRKSEGVGIHRDTQGYKRIHTDTHGYTRIHTDTQGEVGGGRGIHRDTQGYKGRGRF